MMYLYAQVLIDNQPITFAALITGISTGSSVVYTLFPTTSFIQDGEITFICVEKDSGCYSVCYQRGSDKKRGFFSNTEALKIWTDNKIEGINP